MPENVFDGIYKKINEISAAFGPLPEFPLIVDMEITSVCNLKCVMCEHTYMDRQQKHMPIEVFKNIIDQCVPYKPGIRFILFSEPFLLPDIIERCRYVKERGMPLHVTTNGTVLTQEHIISLLKLGLDSITFSFQGATEEEYGVIRACPDKYTRLRENIQVLKEKRDDLGKDIPFIQVSTTVTERDDVDDVEMFRNEMGRFADRVTVGNTSWARIVKCKPDIFDDLNISNRKVKGKYVPCQDIFTKIAILSSGNATVCCDDAEGLLTVGNVKDESIKEIWQSEVYQGIRLLLKNMRMDMLKVCRDCYPAYNFVGEKVSGGKSNAG